MNQADRFAFQTDTINRALQHDLVLYGDATPDSQLVFGWRSARGRFGPEFADRDLAIDWFAEWLDNKDGASEDFHSVAVRPARHGRRRGRVLPPVARIDRARHMAASAQHSRCEPRR